MTSILAKFDAEESLSLDEVEQALSGKLCDLQGDDDAPSQRVRMSNLIIYCNTREVAEHIAEQIPDVVAAHPARVLFLVGEPGVGPSELRASVSVDAHAFGRHQQSCTEVVFLLASGEAVHRLHFAVRSLLVGDLPTNLWWACPIPPGLGGDFLFNLAVQSQQVIYDSDGWPDPVPGVATTAAWLKNIEETKIPRKWRVASDLNWRRLKYWRRLLGQALDEGSAPGAAETITQVEVEHGPHGVVEAWLYVSWLAKRLQWQVRKGKVESKKEMDWTFDRAGGETTVTVRRLDEGTPNVLTVRLHCSIDNQATVMTLGYAQPHRLGISLPGQDTETRTIAIPALSAAEIVGRQLSDRERDPAFRESMAVAKTLAESLR